jgi:hypothetical protein
MGKAETPAWRSLPVVTWVLALTALILAPLARPGYVLLRDMVFTPRQFLTDDAWGVGGAVPRAVPVDAMVAVATMVVDGAVVQRVCLVAALVLAGLGAARLVPGGRLNAAGAATVMVWNPYVAERLLMGHWSLLLGYASLPWLAGALVDLRSGDSTALARAGAWCALASITPGGGVISLLLLATMVLWPGGRHSIGSRALLLTAWVVLNAPWWLAGGLHPSSSLSDPAAVAIFAARADTPSGVLGSLLGLGGVWNADAVPVSRGSWLSVLLTALLLVGAALGYPVLRRLWGRTAEALLVAGVLGLALAGWGVWSEGSLAWVVANVPGGGLLRDGQRLVAPWAVVLAVCVPLGVRRVADAVGDRIAVLALGASVMLAPVVFLPDLAAGAWGRLTPVSYPPAWDAVVEVVATAPDHGVVSLPWQPLRRFAWNGDRPLLDPAPRLLPAPVLTSTDLPVGTDRGVVTITGEDARASAVGDALASGARLTDVLPPLGVGWVLVSAELSGETTGQLVGAEVVLRDDGLTLYRLPAPAPDALIRAQPYAPWVAASYVAALLGVAVCIAVSVVSARRAARLSSHKPNLGRNGT